MFLILCSKMSVTNICWTREKFNCRVIKKQRIVQALIISGYLSRVSTMCWVPWPAIPRACRRPGNGTQGQPALAGDSSFSGNWSLLRAHSSAQQTSISPPPSPEQILHLELIYRWSRNEVEDPHKTLSIHSPFAVITVSKLVGNDLVTSDTVVTAKQFLG